MVTYYIRNSSISVGNPVAEASRFREPSTMLERAKAGRFRYRRELDDRDECPIPPTLIELLPISVAP